MWPFSKKRKSPTGFPGEVPYKSPETFFEMQCKYGHTDIVPEQGVVAMVLDSSKEFGTPDAVKIESDGRQKVTLKVASDDGGFITISETPKAGGDRLKPGDIVVWLPMAHSKEIADQLGREIDKRFAWVGFVIAKIAPVMTSNNELKVICRYD